MASSSLVIPVGNGRLLSRPELSSLLRTYNCFLKDNTNQHLILHETGSHVTLEGLLVIFWGVRMPIHLKMQDETQPASPESPDPTELLGAKRGMTRWGEFDDLLHLDQMEAVPRDHNAAPLESGTLRVPRRKAELDEASNLFRTMSDASLVKGARGRTSDRHQAQQHRFSINGHFYNYKTSIFTPSFGTPTNVRISSTMTTREVIVQLLKKFKVENDPMEFALYCIHQSGEKRKLSDSDFPLWERLLQGPSQSVVKMFLMEGDEREVSGDVAQYLNLDLFFLEGVLHRLKEQEDREIRGVVEKYRQWEVLLKQCLRSKVTVKVETTV
ncbi:ras association domain-containing protein 6 [Paramormyrops kingsleyae]|uniref:Ras association domain family member 6 n=1 Tax=Paramormyrops kingsleyae TaxID=1676925 RepID=A0A3B3QM29_9TELE|nr:ras association domain-containing protein 6-like [Paramormyrops kingsleyae]XP_023664286.1 ras association domain-containing protein 6-like [Paramormyrops kingsleyae]